MTRTEKQQRNREEARAQFMALVVEILEMTEAINDAASDHFDLTPEEIHFGHVGDAARTRDKLKDILDQICGEGEYARPEGK